MQTGRLSTGFDTTECGWRYRIPGSGALIVFVLVIVRLHFPLFYAYDRDRFGIAVIAAVQ